MITVAIGYCPGGCVSSATEITLHTYHYYEGNNSTKPGYYEGKLPASDWDRISAEVDKIDINSLHTEDTPVADDTWIEVLIKSEGRITHLKSVTYKKMPAKLMKVINLVLGTSKKVKLTKSDESYPFKTTYQQTNIVVKPKFAPVNR
ncbi:DUF6438 domain-containing protein [Mucilaginibacter terrenus]|nr:DUF6438 domain-containing protein [Mucilaginibacter terrenus]